MTTIERSLDAAWTAAEAALPDYAAGLSVGHATYRQEAPDPKLFYAHIITACEPEIGAYGPTPAAALWALRTALRAVLK